MANDRFKCPLCEGFGELTTTAIAEKLATPELRRRLEARLAEIAHSAMPAVSGTRVRNFEKEVHEWNPELPMWRRSPKE
jgi:hypothetical protein